MFLKLIIHFRAHDLEIASDIGADLKAEIWSDFRFPTGWFVMEVQMRSPSGGADGEEEAATTVSALRLLPFAGAAQQHYVSELLSFTLDRLHKVIPPPRSFNRGVRSGKGVWPCRSRSFFASMRSAFGGRCRKWPSGTTVPSLPLQMPSPSSRSSFPDSINTLILWYPLNASCKPYFCHCAFEALPCSSPCNPWYFRN